MRAIKALAVAALVAADVGAATAQSTRGFKDSWFWGIKGGLMSYSVLSDSNALSPMVGIDWLITRTNGGLYVSYDHTLFDQFIVVNDSVHPEDACPTTLRPECRRVDLSGMRRFQMAAMIFPLQRYSVHPYFGLGVAIHHIANATPETATFETAFGVPYRNSTQFQLVSATVQQFRTAAAPLVILGTQLRLPLVSAFGQLSISPANTNFLLSYNRPYRIALEAGARYNVGSSIDRMR